MPRRAIFLDRDGTLTAPGGGPAERLELLPGTAAAIRRINRAGWQVVVVTHETHVAMGRLDEDTLAELHERWRAELLEEEARIDGIYHCPHDPQAEVERYRRECRCRPPALGLFEKARDEIGIELDSSFVLGCVRERLPAAGETGLTPQLLEPVGDNPDCSALDDAVADVLDRAG